MPCITEVDLDASNARKSRLPKIMSHLFFDCDISVYCDANIHLKSSVKIEEVVDKYLKDADILVQKHFMRDCVYEEIEAAKARVKTKEEIELLNKQSEHYKSIGFPVHCKTLAGYQPLIRRHNDRVKAFNEAWWNEISQFSYRDQCSFPVVLSRFPDLKVAWIKDFADITKRKYKHYYIKK